MSSSTRSSSDCTRWTLGRRCRAETGGVSSSWGWALGSSLLELLLESDPGSFGGGVVGNGCCVAASDGVVDGAGVSGGAGGGGGGVGGFAREGELLGGGFGRRWRLRSAGFGGLILLCLTGSC